MDTNSRSTSSHDTPTEGEECLRNSLWANSYM
jgi:hypothetical protein